MKEWFKNKWRQFRACQLHPVEYHNSSAATRCANCGTDFTGNYCPCCGQPANVGRLTLKQLWDSIAMMWGIGSRSMLYTIWQLIWRPGYLIHDYLSGKRNLSFPPVKMAFIVAMVLSLIRVWLLPETSAPQDEAGEYAYILSFYHWGANNPALFTMVITLFFILPTWVFFHESPRQPRHTLIEGFFIQAFIMTPMLLVMVGIPENVYSANFVIILYPYYYYVYKQLFGYGYWGTFWRWIAASLAKFLLEGLVVLGVAIFLEPLSPKEAFYYPITMGVIIVLLLILLGAGFMIDRHIAKRRKPAANT